MRRLLTFVFFNFIFVLCFPQAGILDSDFDADGKLITNVNPSGIDAGLASFIEPNGKIIVAGVANTPQNYQYVCITKYNIDGTLDNSFGINGIVTTNIDSSFYPRCMIFQNDGKILIGGSIYYNSAPQNYSDFMVKRLLQNGNLDSTFSVDGKVITDINGYAEEINAITLTNDSLIIAVGFSRDDINEKDFAIVRYNFDGTLDTSFDMDGKVISNFDTISQTWLEAKTVLVQNDNKVIVSGSYNWVDTNGKVREYVAIQRYLANGQLDNAFSIDGKVLTEIGPTIDTYYYQSINIQNDNKIIVINTSRDTSNKYDIVSIRYNTDGSIDNSYGNNGRSFIDIGGNQDDEDLVLTSLLQSDSKLLIIGSTFRPTTTTDADFFILRLDELGNIDNTFGSMGKVITDFLGGTDVPYSANLQANGRLVLVGGARPTNNQWDFALARYLMDLNLGVLDNDLTSQIYIYPNPIIDKFKLEYELQSSESISIELFDNEGVLVKTLCQDEHRNQGKYIETLNIDEIAGGSYILALRSSTFSYNIKVFKLH